MNFDKIKYFIDLVECRYPIDRQEKDSSRTDRSRVDFNIS